MTRFLMIALALLMVALFASPVIVKVQHDFAQINAAFTPSR